MPTLDISPEKVAWIILRARVFQGQPGTILERSSDDPTRKELVRFLGALNDDEKVNLVALGWLGRGTYIMSEWDRALKMARREKLNSAVDYLLSNPLLAEQLENGLDAFGYSMNKLSSAA